MSYINDILMNCFYHIAGWNIDITQNVVTEAIRKTLRDKRPLFRQILWYTFSLSDHFYGRCFSRQLIFTVHVLLVSWLLWYIFSFSACIIEVSWQEEDFYRKLNILLSSELLKFNLFSSHKKGCIDATMQNIATDRA